MTDTTGGHQCPECGAPKGPDNSPSCDCNQRASDALRDARTAEQAAAEDFDPLRIRPYIDVEAGAGTAEGGETEPMPVVEPAVPVESTVPLRAVPVPTVPDAEPPYGDGPGVPPEEPRRRSRRALLLSVAGAVVAILAVAGFVSGLFAHLTPTRDGAGPEDVRESVPDVTPTSASAVTPTASPSVTSATPSPSASASPSSTPSPSSSSPTPSRTPSRSATPTVSASTGGTSASQEPGTPPVLRLGDSGAEVTELQLRLKQLSLYSGNADGDYDQKTEDAVRTYQLTRGILADESGVYGAATRKALESETKEP
ncbi:peptidoglycan-binding domain-containing protein [Streptomyces sasae]|uniref:peptidoglycan-binding domain-containing protein n=1 Tax=Streptomyces sasae TaxID=1266772 RepID=UPI00292D1378|nr:peptidoglycan-binding domain-containing protein [Streptomyces sasae]